MEEVKFKHTNGMLFEASDAEALSQIADAIRNGPGKNAVIDIKEYDIEVDIDNQTYDRVDVICLGDYVVISPDNPIGYYIYPTKAEMEEEWLKS